MLTEKEKEYITTIVGKTFKGKDFSYLLDEIQVLPNEVPSYQDLDEAFNIASFPYTHMMKVNLAKHIMKAPAVSLPTKKIFIMNRENTSLLCHEFFHQLQYHIIYESSVDTGRKLVEEHYNWMLSRYSEVENPYRWFNQENKNILAIPTLEGQGQMIEDFSIYYLAEKYKGQNFSSHTQNMANLLYFGGFRSNAIQEVKTPRTVINE